MGRPVAYGQVFGSNACLPVPAAASQVFEAKGGKFVYLHSTARTAILAGQSDTTDLVGWADVGSMTTASTAGEDIINVNMAQDGVYEIGINGSQTESELKTKIGEVCDLYINASIQYAAINSATDDTLKILGYKYYGSLLGEQSVLVRLNQINITLTGVA